MTRRRKNGLFDFAKTKVTYHRDVAKERRELRKHAMEERREKLAQKKQDAAERAHEDKQSEAEERHRKAERKKADAVDRKIEREMRESGARNPTWGHGVYEPGFMGETQLAHFKSRAAAETYVRSHGIKGAKIKRAFAKNPKELRGVDKRAGGQDTYGKSYEQTTSSQAEARKVAGRDGSYKSGYTRDERGFWNPGGSGSRYRNASANPAKRSNPNFTYTQVKQIPSSDRRPGMTHEFYEKKGSKLLRRWAGTKSEMQATRRQAVRNNPSNPVDSAADLSESWHGRPAETATDYQEKLHYHGVLTDLGRLKEIMVMVDDRKGQNILFDAKTRLASSENGKQLYVVGGDQSIDLKALGIRGEEAQKDLVFVGEVHHIVYITAKEHLGKEDKISGPYIHKLGEESGVMPILLYDTLNQKVGFAGGNYFIDPTDYDGSHSAGIRD